MRQFKAIRVNELVSLTCDGCGQQACINDSDFYEFININHQCGYSSLHGDGKQISIDLCQHCFAGMCGDLLTVTDPLDNTDIDDSHDSLKYRNTFSAISRSQGVAQTLKQDPDIRIGVRDILLANKITTSEELNVALNRVEQLWDAQYHSAQGNELHKLADLICCYEKKDWDPYFNESSVVSDDFMSDRVDIVTELPDENMGKASGILFDTPINPNIDDDDSRQSSIEDDT